MFEHLHRMRSVLGYRYRDVHSLLDAGCHYGEFALIFRKRFGLTDVCGIEIDEGAARVARRKGIDVKCLDLNDGDTPFESDRFDAVFAGEIIEHLWAPDAMLQEMHRVLRPGGYCIVTMPNIASWCDRLSLILGYQPYSIPTRSKYRGIGAVLSRSRDVTTRTTGFIRPGGRYPHLQFFTFRAIKALMMRHGYEIESAWGTPADEFTFPINPVARRIIQWVDRTISISRIINRMSFVASGTVIVARAVK